MMGNLAHTLSQIDIDGSDEPVPKPTRSYGSINSHSSQRVVKDDTTTGSMMIFDDDLN